MGARVLESVVQQQVIRLETATLSKMNTSTLSKLKDTLTPVAKRV